MRRPRRIAVLLALFGVAVTAFADPPADDVPEAEATGRWKFKSAKANEAQTAYWQAMKAARAKFAADLGPAMKGATDAGQLDEAVKLRDAINALKGVAPPDAVVFNGHKYKFISEPATWHVARDRCDAMGGYLVCIGSRAENDFVEKHAKGKFTWLGASAEEEQGKWIWTNGLSVRSFYWSKGQPNNLQSIQLHLCMVADGLWGDQESGHKYQYVCEWDR